MDGGWGLGDSVTRVEFPSLLFSLLISRPTTPKNCLMVISVVPAAMIHFTLVYLRERHHPTPNPHNGQLSQRLSDSLHLLGSTAVDQSLF